jgi:hypothetical protein
MVVRQVTGHVNVNLTRMVRSTWLCRLTSPVGIYRAGGRLQPVLRVRRLYAKLLKHCNAVKPSEPQVRQVRSECESVGRARFWRLQPNLDCMK